MSCPTVDIEIVTLRTDITFEVVDDSSDLAYNCGSSEDIFANLFFTADEGKLLADSDNELVVPG